MSLGIDDFQAVCKIFKARFFKPQIFGYFLGAQPIAWIVEGLLALVLDSGIVTDPSLKIKVSLVCNEQWLFSLILGHCHPFRDFF